MLYKRQRFIISLYSVFLKSECKLTGDLAKRAKKLVKLTEDQSDDFLIEYVGSIRKALDKARAEQEEYDKKKAFDILLKILIENEKRRVNETQKAIR